MENNNLAIKDEDNIHKVEDNNNIEISSTSDILDKDTEDNKSIVKCSNNICSLEDNDDIEEISDSEDVVNIDDLEVKEGDMFYDCLKSLENVDLTDINDEKLEEIYHLLGKVEDNIELSLLKIE